MSRNIILKARRSTVIVLVTLGLIVLISGIMLETAPSGPESGNAVAFGVSKEIWTDIHVYAGFIVAGATIVHVYTNYRGVLYHLGILKSRRKKKN